MIQLVSFQHQFSFLFAHQWRKFPELDGSHFKSYTPCPQVCVPSHSCITFNQLTWLAHPPYPSFHGLLVALLLVCPIPFFMALLMYRAFPRLQGQGRPIHPTLKTKHLTPYHFQNRSV